MWPDDMVCLLKGTPSYSHFGEETRNQRIRVDGGYQAGTGSVRVAAQWGEVHPHGKCSGVAALTML